MRTLSVSLTMTLVAATVATLGADVYDAQTSNDNTPASTRNELVHSTEQWHDLAAVAGVRDEDWYRLRQQPYSSYEVTIDSVSSDLGNTVRLTRIANDGATVVQQGVSVGLGYARSLRFTNDTGTAIDDQYIVVRGGVCATACNGDDVYRLRMVETTIAMPRFNNSGTQVTVVLLQNPATYVVAGTMYFWSASGTPVGTQPFTLSPKQLQVVNTSTIAPGTSGAITVTHDARYGDLAGKSIALEPATGFSFDTPIQYKPR